jgi:cysteine desulfuration protein SufE
MAVYPEKLAKLVDTLSGIGDRSDRIQLLIDIAGRFNKVRVPEGVASRPYPEANKVPACESQAYVWAEELPDKTLRYYFAVENPQGISAMATSVILGETLSGAPLRQVLQVPGDVILTIFGEELSMGKNMGLMGILAMVQGFAKRRIASEGEYPAG